MSSYLTRAYIVHELEAQSYAREQRGLGRLVEADYSHIEQRWVITVYLGAVCGTLAPDWFRDAWHNGTREVPGGRR
jgi:hypothetical protein